MSRATTSKCRALYSMTPHLWDEILADIIRNGKLASTRQLGASVLPPIRRLYASTPWPSSCSSNNSHRTCSHMVIYIRGVQLCRAGDNDVVVAIGITTGTAPARASVNSSQLTILKGTASVLSSIWTKRNQRYALYSNTNNISSLG